MGYVVFKGFPSFLTTGFFCFFTPCEPLSSWQRGAHPSLGQVGSLSLSVATPVRKEEES